jgi:transcriptional regulator with XRE-family HTH domain
MAVNRDGSEIKVDRFVLSADDLVGGGTNNKPTVRDMRANDDHGLSVDDLHNAVIKGLERSAIRFDWIHDLFSDQVVFTSGDEFFIVPYTLDQTTGMVTIMGIPLPVERSVSFTPKINKGDDMKLITNGQLADRLNRLLDQLSDGDAEARSELIDRMASAAGISRSTVSQILRAEIEIPPEDRLRGFAEVLGVSLESLMSLVDNSEKGDAMKQAIVNALKKAEVQTDGLSDDQILAKYNELQANQSEGDGDDAGNDTANLATVVANALKPVTEELAGLKARLNAQSDADIVKMADLVGNSDKYPGITAEVAKTMPVDTLREMSANCGNAHGIPTHNNFGDDDKSSIATEMPE